MATDLGALVGGGSGPTQPWAVALIVVVGIGIAVVWIRRSMRK
jgi:hypothetical protein